MSSKKNNTKLKDKFFMSLAMQLARNRKGLTGENPSVGCVIVKNNNIISSGQTGINGVPHAEYNAIKNCKKDIKGSTLYVTMEPCTHYGKTPPCTKKIIESKIKKVFYAINDIDKRTANKAYEILKLKKITVKKNILNEDAKNLYKPYILNKTKKIPYVIGKIACSKDLFIKSTKDNITNEHSRKVSHLLRYHNHGILISSKTLNNDNSQLTCRINGLEKYSPIRFILDRNLNSKMNSYVVKTAKKYKTFFFYNKASKEKMLKLKKKGIKLIHMNLNDNKLFNLKEVLQKVYNCGAYSIVVEGGKLLTHNILKQKLFNEFYLFKSPKKLGSLGMLNVSSQLHQLSFKYKNKSNIKSFTGKDIVKIYT